jgi:beta-glucosidase
MIQGTGRIQAGQGLDLKNGISRRQVGGTLGAAAASLAGGAAFPMAAGAQPAPGHLSFPKGFVWGCATAAYQVEGAATEDGRGPSNWDVFSHTPGKTHEGDTGDVADDSYHLYQQDRQCMNALGVGGHRMSLSWSRIFPEGKGQPNQKGVDHYHKVIDDLLEHGVDPYVTLFHWDLPAALAGGWQNRDTSQAYADYAGFVAKTYSDKIRHFFTTNEFVCFTDLSYKIGQFAPGLKLPDAEVNQIRHHGILAHGLGVQAIRAHAKSGTQIGLAENAQVFVPVIEEAKHIEAAKLATRDRNAQFLTAVMEGKYTDAYLAREGANAPKFTDADMKAIGSPLDFVGLNVYTPDYVRAADTPAGYVVEPRQMNSPHMASPWLFIGPEVIYWAVRNVSELWSPKALYITENGCSAEDVVVDGSHVEDTDRVMYLRNHLTHLHRAAAEGYPIKGYFLWSLLDNFEWADGYSKRFGLYFVDYKTQTRIPKLSAEWYKRVVADNAVA